MVYGKKIRDKVTNQMLYTICSEIIPFVFPLKFIFIFDDIKLQLL